MKSTTRIGLVTLGMGVLALGACSSDTSPTYSVSDTQISNDVAVDIGDAGASSTDAMVASEALYDGDQPAGAIMHESAFGGVSAQSAAGSSSTVCSGPSATGWFSCTSDTEKGLTVVRAIRFWDGTNFGLKFDATTDSVNHTLLRTGTLTPSSIRTRWVNRADTVTMNVTRASGQVVAARTWTGTGQVADSSLVTDSIGNRSYHYTAFDTAGSIKYLIPRSSNPYPLSGTLTHSVTVGLRATKGTQTYNKTETRRTVITFNGTETVPFTVGGLTCTLDLGTHAVTNCQ